MTSGNMFVKLSYAAYCSPSSVQHWNCKWCDQVPEFKYVASDANRSADTYAYAGLMPAQQLILAVFRGTSNIENWLQDGDFAKVPYPLFGNNSEVHKGFYEDYNSLRSTIVGSVLSMHRANPSFRVAVSGHSLGAALATLCVAELHQSHALTASLWDFGRPRVGNVAFASAFDALGLASFRHVNDRDIVPHLPPEDLGFRHTVREVWEKPKCSFKMCSATDGEDSKCSDSLTLPNSVEDHLHYYEIYESC
jgi:Lipase (class 3)